MMTRVCNRRGMALPMVLGAIVIIAALIAASMYVSTQDHRIAVNTGRESQAVAVAEYGLNRVVQDWQLTWNSSMKTGDTLQRTYSVNGGTTNVIVTRLPGPFFWGVSEATIGTPNQQARRRYGSLFRLNTPNVSYLGAVTAAGNVNVAGNVTVNGNDASPTGWGSCGTLTNVPGAVITPTATVTTKGSVTVTGNPAYTTSTAAADTNTYFNYGGSTYSSLAAAANITIPGGTYTGMAPVVSGSACLTSNPNNWGDPVRHTPAAACESYFPIIHVTGDMKATGGTGQGILLVDGDLTEGGNFSFFGLVIARGTVRANGNSNAVTGAVMAAAVDLGDAVTLTGTTTVQYSSCALQTVMTNSSYPAPAKSRPWVDLY